MENLLKEYMAKNDIIIQSQAASLRNLENQVGQLAAALNNRPQGALLSDIENPRRDEKEHCKVITFSGKQLETPQKNLISDQESVQKEEGKEQQVPESSDQRAGTGKIATAQKSSTDLTSAKPPLPFPQRLQKQTQDKQFKVILDVLKQLHINIPFVEALEQMPRYAKVLKEILSKKRRFGEFETVALTEESSFVLRNKLPPKLKDPGSFTIPCAIGSHYVGRALCDLGASINLMPMSVFKKLGVGEARPTTVTLQLADRSLAQPEGKIEDVLVKVDKFIFPADFIVLDFEADRDVPIILGRPFLATGKTFIDVEKGELTMRVNDEQVTFHVFRNMRSPREIKDCSIIEVVDNMEPQESTFMSGKDPPLSKNQEERWLEALMKLKKALGWTISDFQGINLLNCLYQTLLDKCCSNTFQQRKLDQIMEEVTRREVIKWLEIEESYHISDMTSWRAYINCLKLNLDEKAFEKRRLLQLHELEELHHLPYKEKASISFLDQT